MLANAEKRGRRHVMDLSTAQAFPLFRIQAPPMSPAIAFPTMVTAFQLPSTINRGVPYARFGGRFEIRRRHCFLTTNRDGLKRKDGSSLVKVPKSVMKVHADDKSNLYI